MPNKQTRKGRAKPPQTNPKGKPFCPPDFFSSLLNRDTEGDEAEKCLSSKIKHFERYACDLPGGAEMIAELELIRSRAGRRRTERTRKEMVLQASMSLREGTDHRGTARASWSAYVEKEPEA